MPFSTRAAIAVTIIAVTLILGSRDGLSAQSGKGGVISVESLPCAYTFTSGSGPSFFKWCLTSDGNIGWIESPMGSQHVYAEGYAVCWAQGGMNYWDYGNDQSGFSPPVIVSGCTTGSACTLRRDTADGRFRLKMVFTPNKSEREINIVHTLTNLSAQSVSEITVARQADFDMNNDAADDSFGSSDLSIWMIQGRPRIGLSRLTFTGVSSASLGYGGPNLSANPCGLLAPTGDDLAIGQTYSFSKLASQQNKSVKWQYRRD